MTRTEPTTPLAAALARAEAAEARAEELRYALRLIDALDPETHINVFSESAAKGVALRMGEIARTALGDTQ